MTSRFLLVASLFSALVITASSDAKAGDPLGMTEVWSHNFSMDRTWHSPYQTQRWGQPLALVVPPTAHMRQSYSWGVSQNLMHPIYHQFGRMNNPALPATAVSITRPHGLATPTNSATPMFAALGNNYRDPQISLFKRIRAIARVLFCV